MNRDILENAMGYGGFEYINDTEVHSAPENQYFVALQVIADTVIAAVRGEKLTGNTFTGEIIPSGTVIYGQFSKITLTSGKLIAYKGV
jgi:hypothetical protein